MNWEKYKQLILTSIPNAKLVKGGQEIQCRCRNCSDSLDPRSAHMYISIPTTDDQPSFYFCHKCGSKGIVDHNTLIAWDIFDKDVAYDLSNHNQTCRRSSSSTKYFGSQTYQITNTYTNIDSKSEQKRKYIVERLGINLSFSDLKDLKIVLNLLDLVNENNIDKFTRDKNIINDLDREFIGFLSIDNAYLNMRRTCPEGRVYKSIDKRYINYQIFNKFSTEERFYTIPTRVDLNSKDPIKLHIAEGPFDILSIYLNLRHKEEGIYTSITGNNPVSVLMYFLSGLMIPNIEIHYYVDNDKFGRAERIAKLLRQIPDYRYHNVFLHRNIYGDEKDFGVSIDRINESITQLKL